MIDENECLRRIQRLILDQCPDAYLSFHSSQGLLAVYGVGASVVDAIKQMAELADDCGMRVEQREWVLCSGSNHATIGTGRTRKPQPVHQDSRGITLMCNKNHTHQWPNDYGPQHPFSF